MSDQLITDILRKDRQEVKSKRFRKNCLIIGIAIMFLAGVVLAFGLPKLVCP